MGSEREHELLRQILANPTDLSVRSIYADMLQARDDPRGELIALELAGDQLRARALLDHHAKTWWPEVPRRRLATRDGFIERIAVSAREVATSAHVLASEPIPDLEITHLHPTLFLPAHQLEVRPRRLVLHGGGSTWPRVLADTSSVEHLDLSRSGLDGALPFGTAFASCRELVLADNQYLGQNLTKVLAQWPALAQLEMLDLRWTGLVPEFLRDVIALGLGAVRTLKLSRNPLGLNGAHVLARAIEKLPALRELEVLECGFDRPALAILEAACGDRVHVTRAMPEVVTLDLVGSQVTLRRKRVGAWEVEVDGTKRVVRWTSQSSDDRPGHRTTQPWQMAEVAPFDALALAIASGARRELTENGCSIELGSEIGYVYNTSVISRESAEIEYDLRGSTIAITFGSYTSVD